MGWKAINRTASGSPDGEIEVDSEHSEYEEKEDDEDADDPGSHAAGSKETERPKSSSAPNSKKRRRLPTEKLGIDVPKRKRAKKENATAATRRVAEGTKKTTNGSKARVKEQNWNKGPYTEREDAIIERAIREFRDEKDWTEEEFKEWLWKREKTKEGFWDKILAELPDRRRQSLYMHVRSLKKWRMWENHSWTDEELAELNQLYHSLNGNWKQIGLELERDPQECRRRHAIQFTKKDNYHNPDRYSLEEDYKLIDAVKNALERVGVELVDGKVWGAFEPNKTPFSWTEIQKETGRPRNECRHRFCYLYNYWKKGKSMDDLTWLCRGPRDEKTGERIPISALTDSQKMVLKRRVLEGASSGKRPRDLNLEELNEELPITTGEPLAQPLTAEEYFKEWQKLQRKLTKDEKAQCFWLVKKGPKSAKARKNTGRAENSDEVVTEGNDEEQSEAGSKAEKSQKVNKRYPLSKDTIEDSDEELAEDEGEETSVAAKPSNTEKTNEEAGEAAAQKEDQEVWQQKRKAVHHRGQKMEKRNGKPKGGGSNEALEGFEPIEVVPAIEDYEAVGDETVAGDETIYTESGDARKLSKKGRASLLSLVTVRLVNSEMRSPSKLDWDAIASLLPKAKKRGYTAELCKSEYAKLARRSVQLSEWTWLVRVIEKLGVDSVDDIDWVKVSTISGEDAVFSHPDTLHRVFKKLMRSIDGTEGRPLTTVIRKLKEAANAQMGGTQG